MTSKHERMAGRCYQHPPAAHFHSRKPPLLAASEFIPVSKVRFTIAQVNNDTKVWADMWMETQMAMGQVQQMAITDNASKNTIQQRLDELKP
ncbi:TPA: hypothetical protein ACF2WD_005070 [Escherichia coli]